MDLNLEFNGDVPKKEHTILVWEWSAAPQALREFSPHGGDEDWVALVPIGYTDYIPWLERSSFGVCDISQHETPWGTLYIGAHS